MFWIQNIHLRSYTASAFAPAQRSSGGNLDDRKRPPGPGPPLRIAATPPAQHGPSKFSWVTRASGPRGPPRCRRGGACALEKKSTGECVERAAHGGPGMRSGRGCAPAAALPGRRGARHEWSLRIEAHRERFGGRCGRGAGTRRRSPSRRTWREGGPSRRGRWRVSLGQGRSGSRLWARRTLKCGKDR